MTCILCALITLLTGMVNWHPDNSLAHWHGLLYSVITEIDQMQCQQGNFRFSTDALLPFGKSHIKEESSASATGMASTGSEGDLGLPR